MDTHRAPKPSVQEAANQAGPTPGSPVPALPGRRVLRDEVVLVLALSLAASALYAIVDILSAPIRGVEAPLFADVGLVYQLLNLATSRASRAARRLRGTTWSAMSYSASTIADDPNELVSTASAPASK